MLSRNGIRTARVLCSRCHCLSLGAVSRGFVPIVSSQQRTFHTTQSNRGLLESIVKYLSGDRNRERLHKEIGKILEEYDTNLTRCYNNAYNSVITLPDYFDESTIKPTIPALEPISSPHSMN
jgi:hypothetical protein